MSKKNAYYFSPSWTWGSTLTSNNNHGVSLHNKLSCSVFGHILSVLVMKIYYKPYQHGFSMCDQVTVLVTTLSSEDTRIIIIFHIKPLLFYPLYLSSSQSSVQGSLHKTIWEEDNDKEDRWSITVEYPFFFLKSSSLLPLIQIAIEMPTK